MTFACIFFFTFYFFLLQMKPHEALRLSPDCSGKRFKASGVSKTAPICGRSNF